MPTPARCFARPAATRCCSSTARASGIRSARELLRLSPLNLLWTTEDPYELPVNVGRADGFDLVFTNDAGSVADYGGKAHHMPLAADVVEDPLPLEQRYRDVFFAGVAWPNRVAFLRDLIPRLQGLKAQWLLPYNAHLPKPDLPIPECEWNVRLSFADLIAAARYSKIVLYLERRFSSSGSRGGAFAGQPIVRVGSRRRRADRRFRRRDDPALL